MLEEEVGPNEVCSRLEWILQHRAGQIRESM